MARARGPKWTTEQTKFLAELHGPGHKWQAISSIISTEFPQQAKNGDQCRRRWETLVKVYRKIEGYCGNTRAHTDLRVDELQSLKLETAYHEDWYSIVKEVCDRNHRPAARMASEPSNTVSPSRNIQHGGESSTRVEINSVPRSVERESPSHFHQYGAADIAGAMGMNQPQNSFGPFGLSAWESADSNDMRSYQSMPETKISTASGISSEQVETIYVLDREAPDHIPQCGVENIAGDLDINPLEAFGSGSEISLSWRNIDMRSYQSLYESTNSMGGGISNNILDEDWYDPDWKAYIETLLESEQESDQDTEHETERETEQEIELVQTNIVPMSVDRSSASHIQQYGPVNIAGAMGYNQPQDIFGVFGLSPWEPDESNRMMFMSQISSPSSVSTVMKTEVCVQSSEFIQETDSDSDLLSVSCSQGVGH